MDGGASPDKRSFFKHVFSLEGDRKSELLNICQYALLAILPVILFDKTMRRFSPAIDDRKSSIEIVLELLIQIVVIFIGLLLIHRIITFVPPYSGMDYPDFHMIQIILIALFFLFCFNTSVGEKANILAERVSAYWEGRTPGNKKRKGAAGSGQQTPANQQPEGAAAIAQSLAPPMITQQPTQSQPDYNSFYQRDSTPLIGAASPGGGGEGFQNNPAQGMGGGGMEPQPANAVLGGSFSGFSAW